MPIRPILVVGREELFVDFLQSFPPGRYAVLFAPTAKAAAPLIRSRKPALIVTELSGDPILLAVFKAAEQQGIKVLGLDADQTEDLRSVRVVPPGDHAVVIAAAREILEGKAPAPGGGSPSGPEQVQQRVDRLIEGLAALRRDAREAQEQLSQRLDQQEQALQQVRQELWSLAGSEAAASAKLKLEAGGALLGGLSPFDDDGPTAIRPEGALTDGAAAPQEKPAPKEEPEPLAPQPLVSPAREAPSPVYPSVAPPELAPYDDADDATQKADVNVDQMLEEARQAHEAETRVVTPEGAEEEAAPQPVAPDAPFVYGPEDATQDIPDAPEWQPPGDESPAAGAAPPADAAEQEPEERTDLYAPPDPVESVDGAALPPGEPRPEFTSPVLPGPGAGKRTAMWPFHLLVVAGVLFLAALAVVAYRYSASSDGEQAEGAQPAGEPARDAVAVSPPAPDAAPRPPDAAVPDQAAPAPDAAPRQLPLLDRDDLKPKVRKRLERRLELLVAHSRYLLKRKRILAARSTLQKLLRIDDDYRVFMLLARAHRMAGEPEAAAHQMDIAVSRAPARRRPALSYQLGILRLETGNKDSACAAFRDAAEARRPYRKAVRALKKHCQ